MADVVGCSADIVIVEGNARASVTLSALVSPFAPRRAAIAGVRGEFSSGGIGVADVSSEARVVGDQGLVLLDAMFGAMGCFYVRLCLASW